MGTTRVLSCATAVPARRFTQEETLRLLGYSSPRIRQIFLNSDIEYRHFWADAAAFTPDETPDQLHTRYAEGARHLACRAARGAIEAAGLEPRDLDAIMVASCTGYLCPDLATLLAGHLSLRNDVQRAALLGHGCAGALPLLQRANDFVCAHPGRRVLAIAVEICSTCYYIDSSIETVVGNAICSDGAAAVILADGQLAEGARPSPAGCPQILSFQTILEPAHLDKVGFKQQAGKLRIILAPEIRELAGPMIEKCLESLLSPYGLRRKDVQHWILHPGGRKVIHAAAAFLGLDEEQISFSRRVLRNFGNMSSPTVLFVLDEVLRSGAPQRDDYGVLLALGPGFAAEGALLRW